MNEINQLVLDCMARVLRINQTTDADIFFYYSPHVDCIEINGYKKGYYNSPANKDGRPIVDYLPLGNTTTGMLCIANKDSEEKLRQLLSSLDALEKELINAK
ncbi:hypothetical protein [Caproiciproducens galactitolivorans]|uniref:Uncharacterized protein n=1 Tax=Caproiciproducens galactitolivorans TaxID=642589 RepID=A0ABT4BXZ1_9FIRM|nr:hypothetical protein [Caproiciproducens galactitolivorans]MCY1715195.1 hypothetical protein [Caproiciproducens galactitolivorans]